MTFKFKPSLLAALLATAAALPAQADTLVVDMAGWSTAGLFGDTGNTSAFFTLPAGSTVTSFTYSNLQFTSFGMSFQSELTLSVNNAANFDEFLDWSPSTIESPGMFGPVSGAWNGPTGAPGPFTAGETFEVVGGMNNLFITVFESFDDDGRDATIASGILTVNYAPVPEPATYGLMALGLLGVAAVARRRQAR